MGGSQEVLDKINSRLQQDYPNLHIAGMLSPPFRPLSEDEQADIVTTINQSGAQIVLVALGCPKQEKWMFQHRGKVNAVMLGVGWAFIVYAGEEKRAPQWMITYSLEWLYRLGLQPKRLFKRYFCTNSLFILLMTRQYLSHLFKKSG